MRIFSIFRLLACAGLVIVAQPLRAEDQPSPDPARITAAKELMEATGVMKQMDGIIAAMGQGFRKGAHDAGGGAAANTMGDEFDSQMQRFMSYREAMLEDFAVIYAQRFTAEELNAVTAFYRSPTGEKFIAAMPEMMQAGAQIGMKYSQKAMQAPASKSK
ncbi:MAG: DUF2059 domain-containing protein [Hyphomicrobium sp.]|jgi:hypothetical protein